jgi:hypothetical protein
LHPSDLTYGRFRLFVQTHKKLPAAEISVCLLTVDASGDEESASSVHLYGSGVAQESVVISKFSQGLMSPRSIHFNPLPNNDV